MPVRASYPPATFGYRLLLLLAAGLLTVGCSRPAGSVPPEAAGEPCQTGKVGAGPELMLERWGETLYICSRQTLLAAADGVTAAELADVDGDGKLELLMQWAPPGTDRRRLHVYSAGPSGIVPRWRGSRMSGVLRDFSVPTMRRAGGDPVVTLEHLDGKLSLLMYVWDGFGFAADCTRPLEDPPAREVRLVCSELAVLCEVGAQPPTIACRSD